MVSLNNCYQESGVGSPHGQDCTLSDPSSLDADQGEAAGSRNRGGHGETAASTRTHAHARLDQPLLLLVAAFITLDGSPGAPCEAIKFKPQSLLPVPHTSASAQKRGGSEEGRGWRGEVRVGRG